MAVVLSCIDSRAPAEIIFDLGLGDIFSARVAGNVISPMILGSIEYGCAVAGAKLVMVLGHTGCGAVTAACSHVASHSGITDDKNSQNVNSILRDIESSIDKSACKAAMQSGKHDQAEFVDSVAEHNVRRAVQSIQQLSPTLKQLTESGQVAVVGGMYDIRSGQIDFFVENGLQGSASEHSS
jgi:carbonic anhydrase/SulP family sulfate permease